MTTLRDVFAQRQLPSTQLYPAEQEEDDSGE